MAGPHRRRALIVGLPHTGVASRAGVASPIASRDGVASRTKLVTTEGLVTVWLEQCGLVALEEPATKVGLPLLQKLLKSGTVFRRLAAAAAATDVDTPFVRAASSLFLF